MGFSEEEGIWRRRLTEQAKLMDGIVDMALQSQIRWATDEQLHAELRRRIEHLITTGEAPEPPPWDELRWQRTLHSPGKQDRGRGSSALSRLLRRLFSR